MKIFKVLLDFVLFAVTDKITFFRSVISQLTANPTYPSPEPTLAELKVAVDNFELAILAAKEGGPTAKSAMRDAEKTATSLFRNEAYYVDKEAKGDETKILSSGFHPSKQPVASVKPDIVIVNGFHSGDISIKVKAILYAVAYIWQYRLYNPGAIEGEWISLPITTYARTSLTGLIPGSVYEFRFATISNAGTSEFGQSITHRVM